MEERNLRKTRVGIVVSDKMDKTITVAIQVWQPGKADLDVRTELDACDHT